jgi:hypothetical protein
MPKMPYEPNLAIAPVKIPVILELVAGVDRLYPRELRQIHHNPQNYRHQVLQGVSEIIVFQQAKSADVEYSKAGERFEKNVKAAEIQEKMTGRITEIERKVEEAKKALKKCDGETVEEKLRGVELIASKGLQRQREE